MKMYEMCYSKKIHSASVDAEATTLIFCGSYVTENNKKAKTYRYPKLFALIKIKSFENFLEIINLKKELLQICPAQNIVKQTINYQRA